jgi:transcriptional regulator with XRE-family HTH domain
MGIHFGKRLKGLVDDRKLSVSDLAARTGKTTTAIYEIFKKEDLNTGILKEFAEVLEIPIINLFEEVNTGSQPINHGKGKDLPTFNEADFPKYGLSRNEADLQLCLEKVKGLQREVELLKEVNEMLKKK